MAEHATFCEGCGVTVGDYIDPRLGRPIHLLRCPACPPWTCERCGERCESTLNSCSCWITLADVSHADQKAMFAGIGLSLGLPEDA